MKPQLTTELVQLFLQNQFVMWLCQTPLRPESIEGGLPTASSVVVGKGSVHSLIPPSLIHPQGEGVMIIPVFLEVSDIISSLQHT